MLNSKGLRELAYVVRIDEIKPIEGSDNCEAAYVGGWHVMTRKNTFKAGDLAVYFEIDSHVDTSKPEFAFLERKHGNIKTQKYTFGGKGNFISQGLLMPFSDFEVNGAIPTWLATINLQIASGTFDLNSDARFLTEALGVTYAVPEDNKRKSNGPDKYKSMGARHPKLFKTRPIRWLMRHNWGRKLLYVFFGRKKTRNDWPQWVKKTDEERIQNCPWVLNDTDKEWIATEKIDGSSTTFTYRKDRFKKPVFLVCSRNVAFTKPGKKCYYDTNIYTEMAEKYHMEEVMKDMFECRKRADRGLIFVTIQAETYGAGVQRRDYSREDHDMAIFNVIWGYKDGTVIRWNPEEAKTWVGCWDLPYVPVLGKMALPNDCDEVLALAGAEPSQLDGQMREGLVFRSLDGVDSFKAVSNEYLLKYHG